MRLHGLKICGKLARFFANSPVTLATFKKIKKATVATGNLQHSLLDGKVFHGTNSVLQVCATGWRFSLEPSFFALAKK